MTTEAAFTDRYGMPLTTNSQTALAHYAEGLDLALSQNYGAEEAFALAVEAADSSDPTAIRASIRAVSAPPGEEVGPGVDEIKRALELLRDGQQINYQGASGPVDVDENGDVTGAMGIWKITNGELVTERIVTE